MDWVLQVQEQNRQQKEALGDEECIDGLGAAGPGAEPSAEGEMRSVLMDWVLQVQEQNRQLKER